MEYNKAEVDPTNKTLNKISKTINLEKREHQAQNTSSYNNDELNNAMIISSNDDSFKNKTNILSTGSLRKIILKKENNNHNVNYVKTERGNVINIRIYNQNISIFDEKINQRIPQKSRKEKLKQKMLNYTYSKITDKKEHQKDNQKKEQHQYENALKKDSNSSEIQWMEEWLAKSKDLENQLRTKNVKDIKNKYKIKYNVNKARENKQTRDESFSRKQPQNSHFGIKY